MTLFEIGSEMRQLDAILEEVGGDCTDPAVEAKFTEWIQSLTTEEGRKLDGYVQYLRELEMQVKAAKEEKEYWERKIKTRQASIDWMKRNLKLHLESTNRKKVVTEKGVTITVANNGGALPVELSIIDVMAVPEKFRKVSVTLDKELVREALLAGEELEFARFGQRGTYLRIS